MKFDRTSIKITNASVGPAYFDYSYRFILEPDKRLSRGERIVQTITAAVGLAEPDTMRVRDILRSEAPDLFQGFVNDNTVADSASPTQVTPVRTASDEIAIPLWETCHDLVSSPSAPADLTTSPTSFISHYYGPQARSDGMTIVDISHADPALGKAFKGEIWSKGYALPRDWPFPVWGRDKLPADTPPDFIKRHYGLMLSEGSLVRADIRLDATLYNALAAWLKPDESGRRNTLPPDCPLPIHREVTDAAARQLDIDPEHPLSVPASAKGPEWQTRLALYQRTLRLRTRS